MVKLYNTLTRSLEPFTPIHPPSIGIYSCGPTVYDYQHIGHMRRYVGDDILTRILAYNGYEVKHVMNITDVGHLVSDSDVGEDKMEKGARKFGMSVWDIAKKFEQQFFDSMNLLGIKQPDVVIHATEAITEQIALIQMLEKKGYTYRIADGMYFDTSKFPDYFKLSGQNPEELRAGARVEMVEGKKHLADFALWKFSPKGKKRQMEWESPWGVGFPGWHIECSAMSMKKLGNHFDIHTGGIDHIAIHHTNEIAQSESASGEQFVNYWIHHNFLMVEGKKMSKSIGNIYTVQDIVEKGYDPIALRYLYLQTHYRQEMNFTWESLDAAQNALHNLYAEIADWQEGKTTVPACEEKFLNAINDDMNMAKALSVVWELIKSDASEEAKAATLFKCDTVLGFSLRDRRKKFQTRTVENVSEEIQDILRQRESARKAKNFAASDQLRNVLQEKGYDVEDTDKGSIIRKK